MNVHQAAIADIDARIVRLQTARAVLLELAAAGASRSKVTPIASGRKPLNGTAKVVMEAITSGANTLKGIADSARLKESTARAAVLGLEASGRVKREGKGSLTRYVAA